MASVKKNKNNPENKSNGKVNQNKLRSSEYCEKNCKDVGVCEKYKRYIERLLIGKRGYGLLCDK